MTAPTEKSLNYHVVAKADQVQADYPLRVRFATHDIALFNLGGQIYATDNICTHEYASLTDGEVEGDTVTCPLHSACFDIRTGRALTAPATLDLKTYPVQVQGEDVLIGIPS